MGTVYRAFDERLQRHVAVKEIAGADARRVLREAQAAARLNHPGIVTLYELGSEGDRALLVSELVEGATLAELARSEGLSDREAAEFGADICEALAHAHERGVIHRDIKPQNVIVRVDDGVGPASEADGLRDRVAGGRAGSDGDRRGGRDARLHGAGAGRGRAGRRGGGHLFARPDPVRAVGGHEPRRAGDARSDRQGDRPAASLASRVPPGPPRAARRLRRRLPSPGAGAARPAGRAPQRVGGRASVP